MKHTLLAFEDSIAGSIYAVKFKNGRFIIHGKSFLHSIGSNNPTRMLDKISSKYKLTLRNDQLKERVVLYETNYYDDDIVSCYTTSKKMLRELDGRVFLTDAGILHKFIHSNSILYVPRFEEWFLDYIFPCLLEKNSLEDMDVKIHSIKKLLRER